jgi:hypothetical protein
LLILSRQKWNARLFQEMYAAFKAGRAKTNPADDWYKGELWFFDNYIVRTAQVAQFSFQTPIRCCVPDIESFPACASSQIPLAKKLKECRVFGVSSAEFLDYAMDNRSEWESKGSEIVELLIGEAEAKFGSPSHQVDHESPESVIRIAQERRKSDKRGSGGDLERPEPPQHQARREETAFKPRANDRACIVEEGSGFCVVDSNDDLNLLELGAGGEWPASRDFPESKPPMESKPSAKPPALTAMVGAIGRSSAPRGKTKKLDERARFL